MTDVVAIYGGSFDPPHIGHFLAMASVLALEKVDKIVMVPSAFHPFGKGVAPFEDRVKMSRLVAKKFPRGRVIVSDIEKRKKLDGKTINTIRALRIEMNLQKLRFLVGADILKEKDKWYRFDEIEKEAPLIIIGRKGGENCFGYDFLPEVSPVSSTMIRNMLKEGKDCRAFVFPEVLEYIERRGLYK